MINQAVKGLKSSISQQAIRENKPVFLNDIKTGEIVRVKEIIAGRNCRNKLMEIGILEGAPIKVLSNSGGPLIVMVGNSRFAIGRGMAQKIKVS